MHEAARERLDRDDVAQAGARERREAEEQQLHPACAVAAASTAAVKLPGSIAWQTMYVYANAQATSVNVAPTAYSSSRVISWSASM